MVEHPTTMVAISLSLVRNKNGQKEQCLFPCLLTEMDLAQASLPKSLKATNNINLLIRIV